MKIKLTQSHIDAGVKGDCGSCPVALAVMEATGAKEAGVAGGSMWIEGYRLITSTPAAIRDFIDAFDAGRPVEPFEFDIELERI